MEATMMDRFGLGREVVDTSTFERSVEHFMRAGIVLPTFEQLSDPKKLPDSIRRELGSVPSDEPHPLNLFRVHWYNGSSRQGQVDLPDYLELPEELTGVPAKLVVALGDTFPMIRAHKVLAAYGCLAPKIVSGQFDPITQRAVWPSTGNYCRGGVAISRIMGCRGVAVLPEGMSRERFDWLEQWVADPVDIIRTTGSESNVKEIYDKCEELARNPENVIMNQFSEFGNHIIHYLCTGRALERILDSMREAAPSIRLRAFVAGTGSAGTLGAGDYLKERFDSMTVAVEPLECPTMLYNGFGEHNIQGIGDKHIPLIHNVMNTDVVTAVSDVATDQLNVLFNSDTGREYLSTGRGLQTELVERLSSLGISSICNVLAAIKLAKYFHMGAEDVILTVATDGAAMYQSELEKSLIKHFPGGFEGVAAGEVYMKHMLGASVEHLLELSALDRQRVFNLGYFTWVEQRGVSSDDFNARKDQDFWRTARGILPVWDHLIEDFNGRTGVGGRS